MQTSSSSGSGGSLQSPGSPQDVASEEVVNPTQVSQIFVTPSSSSKGEQGSSAGCSGPDAERSPSCCSDEALTAFAGDSSSIEGEISEGSKPGGSALSSGAFSAIGVIADCSWNFFSQSGPWRAPLVFVQLRQQVSPSFPFQDCLGQPGLQHLPVGFTGVTGSNIIGFRSRASASGAETTATAGEISLLTSRLGSSLMIASGVPTSPSPALVADGDLST
mmetsp:Transcript_137748/g.253345  ORF Transcript_137748/g.253345 Transcript_137748/m.253345 type:complete len:219 (-) Transcript_137748:990-1646(-)